MSPRILFCSQAAYRDGGVEVWLDALAAALGRYGWDVRVALAAGKFHDPAWYLEKHPLPGAIALGGTRGLREGRMLCLQEVFESVGPDVIVPVGLADALYAAAEWKRRGADTRLVTCSHGHVRGPLRDVERCAPFVDLATAVSRRVASVLDAMPRLGGRVAHIPTGVREPDAPPPPRTELRAVAYVGRLDEAEKRAGDLVPFARALRGSGVVLHVAGSGPEEARIRAELAGEAVVFHGAISVDRLYATIYPNVDALVLFSPAEGGPIVAWEAMVHGVVPVVSDFAGRIDEGVIRHEETGLVFPIGDANAAAATVLRVRESALLRALSERVRAELPAGYRLHGFEKQWDAALRRVCSLPAVSAEESLGRFVSPGRIARLGLGERATFRLRALLQAPFEAEDPGSEWPHTYAPDVPPDIR